MSGAEPALLAAGAEGTAGVGAAATTAASAGAAGAGATSAALGEVGAGAGLSAAEISGIPAAVSTAMPTATGGLSGLQVAGLGAAGSSALGAFQKGATATSPNGFSLDAGPPPSPPSVGPTMGAPSGYGAPSPSFLDRTMGYIGRFNGGMNSDMGQAYKGFGNNPETYGFMTRKLGDLMRTAPGAPPPPAMTTNIYNNQGVPNSYGRRGY
jgi:hypothetical protein